MTKNIFNSKTDFTSLRAYIPFLNSTATNLRSSLHVQKSMTQKYFCKRVLATLTNTLN